MPELKTVRLDDMVIPEIRVSSVLNEEQRALLQSTIKEVGVIQDIVVRPLPNEKFEVIAGKSRLEQLRALGFKEVQVKVVGADEKLARIMNIIENVARGSYDYISISRQIRELKKLGTSLEELERIFPWKRRWIEFIEELQDLPDDVTMAISEKTITPTHVMLAANLPTPHETHDGLRTAINLRWDTGTFKTYVQNRVEQIEKAHSEAAAKGVEPEIPMPVPQELIQYLMCNVCGYKKPRQEISMQYICEECRELAKYISDVLGPDVDHKNVVYAAMQAYFSTMAPKSYPTTETKDVASQG